MMKFVSNIMLPLILISTLTITFNIQPAKAEWTGTVYIRADGSIDPPTAPIRRDGSLYTLTDDIYGHVVVEKDSIVIDGAGHALQGIGNGKGIDLSYRTRVTVKNTQIMYFGYGVLLEYSSNCSIIENNIKGNSYYGVYLSHSSNNIITKNNIKENSYDGILLEYSFNNIISKNSISNNEHGVVLYSSSRNRISGNNIKAHFYHGVLLEYSIKNIISKNNITNNWCGIELSYSSDNIISENNIMANNQYGISPYSSDNRFYHNNFIDNYVQVYSAGSINLWDDGYPSGGNYWSDYTGVDLYSGPYQNETGGDGIGDTPYVIDADNIDHYPLMSPWIPTPLYYNLTITTTTGGTTDPSPGTYSFTAEAVVKVSALPNVGYSFDYWLLDGEVRTENPITIIMDKNHVLEAYFIDNIPPMISWLWQNPPDNVQPFENVTVWVNVTDYGAGVKNVTLWYSLDNGATWTVLNMTTRPIPDMKVIYQAIIPGCEANTWVTYKIVAFDNAGNKAMKDKNGFYVVPEFPSTIILSLIMVLTAIATIIAKKRLPKQSHSN